MLTKVVLKKDHYETDVILEFKNCEIVNIDSEWVFIKVKVNESKLNELKKDIIKIINRNPELYCDCKKIIQLKNTFEEVIKVKKNEIEVINCKCDVSIMVYGIWFKSSSYGPMLKLTNFKEIESINSFLPNSEDTDSDDEIKFHYNLKK